MKILLKIFAAVVILTLAVNISISGPRDKFGTSAAPELLIPVGSIGTALSGSNISSIQGIDAMYWNPAGLSVLNSSRGEALFSHMNYFADMRVEYFSAGVNLGSLGTIGVGLKSLVIGDIEETSEIQPEGTGVVYSPTYLVANVSYARRMTDRIRFGTNVKIISENVADVSATGWAFDFGLQYVAGTTGLSFGIALKNLGPSMTFNGPGLDREFININGVKTTQRINLQSFDLPTNLELGVGFDREIYKDFNLGIHAGFVNGSFTSDEYKFGLQFGYKNYFFVRGAFTIYPNKEADESLFGPTFGAGIRYPFGSFSLAFDYAYRVINESAMNSTNQFFTLTLGF
jgi:hypothetical protein